MVEDANRDSFPPEVVVDGNNRVRSGPRQGADEAAVHDGPVRADAEDLQRVRPPAGLPRRVPVHEGPPAAQHRSAGSPPTITLIDAQQPTLTLH